MEIICIQDYTTDESTLGLFKACVKGPSWTQAADRPFFQWMDLERNTAVWFQRFGTTPEQTLF